MEENMPYKLGWAKKEEWAPAMKMIWRTFLEYEGHIYSQEGIKNFFEFITDDDLYMSFLKGQYQLLVARDGEEVIGAGTIRNGNRLSLLFVDEKYHGQGVGRAIMEVLFDYLKQETGEKYMTVLAAPPAVEFYKKLGFYVVKPEETIGGVLVTTMEKVL